MVKRANLFFLASLLFSVCAQADGLNSKTVLECKSLGLEGLNKINARVFSLDVAVKTPAKFENLTITAHRCLMTPADEPYEVAVYLDIHETNPESKNTLVFSGWMFASSPSLSAMEHPIYDVWVKYDQKERDALIPTPVKEPESQRKPLPKPKAKDDDQDNAEDRNTDDVVETVND